MRRARRGSRVKGRMAVTSLLFAIASVVRLAAQSPPTAAGMAGELRELYRVDRLPLYRSGSRVAQVSSYDTTGGNNDGFDGLYSYVRIEGDARVLADLQGPGVVHRMWTPTPTQRMVAFYFDGEAQPRLRLPFIDLFSGSVPPFVSPLVGNEVGGYYSYLPIPYSRSLKIVYEGDDIQFHQIQYRSYPDGTQVESFRSDLPPAADAELDRAVAAWSRRGERPWRDGDVQTAERTFEVEPGGQFELFRMDEGGRIMGIEMERPPGALPRGAGVLLEARWDGVREPAISAPANDFFGYAFGEAAARSYLLGSDAGRDYAYLPMPFDESAVLSIRVLPTEETTARATVRVFYTTEPRNPATEGKLYTTWRRERGPARGEPFLLLEARGRGHHVGTLLQAQGLEPGMTAFFEGDDVTTIDGEVRLHGTGSEDYFNGGWYAMLDRWDRGMSLPLHGALDYNLPLSRTGGYRFFMADKISFEETFRQTIERGPEGNQISVDYTSVSFHYGELPSAGSMDPAATPQPPRSPTEHVFYPQLLELSLWIGTSAAFSDDALEIRAAEDGRVRFDVSALPPGRYRVLLSYRREATAPEFSVWRRQSQVSPWIDPWAETEERVEGADLGEIDLTPEARSLTVRIRGTAERTTLRIHRLIFEEVR